MLRRRRLLLLCLHAMSVSECRDDDEHEPPSSDGSRGDILYDGVDADTCWRWEVSGQRTGLDCNDWAEIQRDLRRQTVREMHNHRRLDQNLGSSSGSEIIESPICCVFDQAEGELVCFVDVEERIGPYSRRPYQYQSVFGISTLKSIARRVQRLREARDSIWAGADESNARRGEGYEA